MLIVPAVWRPCTTRGVTSFHLISAALRCVRPVRVVSTLPFLRWRCWDVNGLKNYPKSQFFSIKVRVWMQVKGNWSSGVLSSCMFFASEQRELGWIRTYKNGLNIAMTWAPGHHCAYESDSWGPRWSMAYGDHGNVPRVGLLTGLQLWWCLLTKFMEHIRLQGRISVNTTDN